MAKKIYISILVASILALGVFSVVNAQAPTPGNDASFESPTLFGERTERSDMPIFHSPALPNGPGPRGGCGGDHELLAEALGLTVDELETALSEGQTVAELAEAQNVALDEVIEAVLAPLAEYLEQAVTDGHLTQEEADARLAEAEDRLLEFFETGVCPEPEECPRPPRPPRGGRGERPDLGE